MDNSNILKPCLVETPQGFTVSYQNKFLYSKYNPSKAILQSIENLQILPGTIILCCSPVLSYGLQELKDKIPSDCLLIICEFDENLRQIETQNIPHDFIIPSINELYNLPVILNKSNYTFECGITYPNPGYFKRVIKVDFSAGTQFYNELYNQLHQSCINSIMTFWSNRVTLTKFGRRYSTNFFRNLKQLSQTSPISSFFNKIEKPIIVCGAGQSLNPALSFIKNNRNSFYILCADTALQPLQDSEIFPDGVFIEEAQAVITKAFIGTKESNVHIFAGLSSLPQINHIFPSSQISYFTTLYADTTFISNAQKNNILPPVNNPFGSVGLTTVYYALKFRKSSEIPVYIYGLDFSYSAGLTHAKNTLAHRTRLFSSNKLNPVQNYRSSFSASSQKILDKKKNPFYTTHTMSNYAVMFNAFFSGEKNLYDASESGIPLSIPSGKPTETKISASSTLSSFPSDTYTTEIKNKIDDYINNEKNALKRLKAILTGELILDEQERNAEIKKIASCREYLYLHFPDGWQFSNNLSFLKRIRTEIDFFLKWM